MRRLVVTTVFLAALTSACGGTEPGDSVTSSTADPSPSVTPSPTAEFSDIGVLVADLEAQSAEERTQFCESVYEDGYVAAAGALAAEGGFQRPDVFRTLKDVCPERVTLTIECDNRRWEATYVIDRNQPDFSEAWADAFPSQVACYAVDVSGYETTISSLSMRPRRPYRPTTATTTSAATRSQSPTRVVSSTAPTGRPTNGP